MQRTDETMVNFYKKLTELRAKRNKSTTLDYRKEIEFLGWTCELTERKMKEGLQAVKVWASKPLPEEPWHGYFNILRTTYSPRSKEYKAFVNDCWKGIYETIMKEEQIKQKEYGSNRLYIR